MKRILVINPGSTSTKISLFEEENNIFTKSVFHDAPVLLQYKSANDQIPLRRKVVEDLLKEYGYSINDIDVFIDFTETPHLFNSFPLYVIGFCVSVIV